MESDLTFRQSHAFVVGVDAYDRAYGIEPLRSAVLDAQALHRVLATKHRFAVTELVDVAAAEFRTQLAALAKRVAADDRVLFYFAGHGLWRDDESGPGGYLLLRDARAREPSTLVAMREVSDTLAAFPCRHMLVVLDCCYGGAFRWSSSRDVVVSRAVSRQRYQRYVEAAAWQAITSAGPDQLALDGFGQRDFGDGVTHSPFAAALIDGLDGKADGNGDGLITATELYLYTRSRVEDETDDRKLQSPGLFPLRKHDRGEFVFRTPGRALKLPRAETLTLALNPYRGLLSFEETDAQIYFGRTRAATALAKTMLGRPLTVVAGASGTGKSSLVKAGLVPSFRRREKLPRPGKPVWRVLGPYRPRDPIDPLLSEEAPPANTMTVVIVDQLEELLTSGSEAGPSHLLEGLARWISVAPERVRVIVTVRSDFEPLLADGPLAPWWKDGRFVVPPMSLDELRAAIEQPADLRDLHFEPSRLVDQIATEVVQMPGALPLLSFTLSELYRVYCERAGDDRALREQDYRELGGVASAVTKRAEDELTSLVQKDPRFERTVRNVMMRTVQEIGGERARRRVARSELRYDDAEENGRVQIVLDRYVDSRLLVVQASGGADFYEPAHDALIAGWPQVLRWLNESAAERSLMRAVGTAASAWADRQNDGDLWDDNSRLPQLAQLIETSHHSLNALELEFVRLSVARRRKLRVRRYALAVLAFGAITSIAVIALVQRSAAIDAREADARGRVRAEQLVDFMAYDLPVQFQTIGQPQAMSKSSDEIAGYYAKLRKEKSALDSDQRRRIIAGTNALGNVRLEQDQLDTAQQGFAEALQLARSLAADLPADGAVQRDIYVAHLGLSAVAFARQDWSRATDEARSARTISEALLAGGDEPRRRLDRALAMFREAQVAVRVHEPTARAQVQKVVDELESVVGPAGKERASILALSQALRALVELMDPNSEGEAQAQRGMEIRSLLERVPREVFDAQVIDAESQAVMAGGQRGHDTLENALATPEFVAASGGILTRMHDTLVLELQTACTDRYMLGRLAPANADLKRSHVECLYLLGQVAAVAGDLNMVEARVTEAWTIQAALEKLPTANADLRRDGTMLLDLAAISRRQRGDFDEAHRLFSESLARMRKLAETDATVQSDVAISLLNLADVELDQGRFADAGKLLEEARAMCKADAPRCAEIRKFIDQRPRAGTDLPLVLRLRATAVKGLDDRVLVGATCFALLRPNPAKPTDCVGATITCNRWRVLGLDLLQGNLAVAGRTPGCKAPSTLDLARGELHVDGAGVIGAYLVDAQVVH